MNFLTEFDRLRSSIWEHDAYRHPGPDPSDIEDLFEPLYQRLTVIRIYGSDAAHKAAGMAVVELVQWTSIGRKDQEALNKAYDDYVELVRNDLGVSQPAGATELVRANE